jgi:hypothetical protein
MKVTSSSFICVDVLVDPLMTNTVTFILPHPQRYLLRAPVLSDLYLNPGPSLRMNTSSLPFTSGYRILMSLFRTINSLAAVSFQFSANGRFMNSNCFSYLRLIVVTFQKCLNLISLTLGELVVAHKRSFDLSVFRGLYYTSLPLLTFKVALMS